MKNIHILPTDKSSRVSIKDSVLILHRLQWRKDTQHIYITDDSEIKKRDWVICAGEVYQIIVTDVKCNDNFTFQTQYQSIFLNPKHCKKIILTTDQDLIKDGVQEIDDEFLEWFIKHPSCEKLNIVSHFNTETNKLTFEVLIPKKAYERTTQSISLSEVDKQETLEEAAEDYGWRIKTNSFSDKVKANELAESSKQDFIAGAKWQQERMYSEEEVKHLMTLAFEQGFKKADVVEAGLEAKETDTEVNWIFLKHKK